MTDHPRAPRMTTEPNGVAAMTESLNPATLADRIRSEAAQADRPGQMARLEAIAEEVEALRRGAKTLGHIVEQNGRMILDVTGLHHFIGEDGDGDWGAVWENAYELMPRIEKALACLDDPRWRDAVDGDWLEAALRGLLGKVAR